MPHDDVLWNRNNMKECWINVYETGLGVYHSLSREFADKRAKSNMRACGTYPIYHIHVKMKNFIRIRLPNDYVVRDTPLKLNWME